MLTDPLNELNLLLVLHLVLWVALEKVSEALYLIGAKSPKELLELLDLLTGNSN